MLIGLESGVHNSDLQKSGKRIIEGGSWKKQRVIMIIPAGPMIPTKAYLSHCSLIFPPNNSSWKIAAIGLEVGEAFSQAIEEILAHPELSQWEYILTIEHDNIPPQDGLMRLIKSMESRPDLHCIGGLYWTKGEEGVPQIWGDAKDPNINYRPQPPDHNGGIIECCGTGMGFNLWRISMFKDKKLRRPFFKTLTGTEGMGVATQDLYFWSDARKHGYKCAVDCSVKVGHLDIATGIIW
jgi:hypothetical protein